MSFRRIMTVIIAIIVPLTISSKAFSFVSQKASSALRGDNFVGDNSSSSNNKSQERKIQEPVKTAAEKEADRKREALTIQRAIVQGANSVENKNCPNAQTLIFDLKGKQIDTINSSNFKYKRERALKELERLGDTSFFQKSNSKKSKGVRENKATASEEKSGTKNSQATASQESQTPAPDYNKHYASKLFSTLSGHITIEQKNIPKRIGITQGSTIQLNLKNDPDTLWFFDLDNKIAKIKSNTTEGDHRVVIIEALEKGNTKMIVDYLSTKTSAYKVISSKRMLIMVD